VKVYGITRPADDAALAKLLFEAVCGEPCTFPTDTEIYELLGSDPVKAILDSQESGLGLDMDDPEHDDDDGQFLLFVPANKSDGVEASPSFVVPVLTDVPVRSLPDALPLADLPVRSLPDALPLADLDQPSPKAEEQAMPMTPPTGTTAPSGSTGRVRAWISQFDKLYLEQLCRRDEDDVLIVPPKNSLIEMVAHGQELGHIAETVTSEGARSHLRKVRADELQALADRSRQKKDLKKQSDKKVKKNTKDK
jgi:hypothetical protein